MTNITDMEIEIYEAEHQPLWLLDLENDDATSEKVEASNDIQTVS